MLPAVQRLLRLSSAGRGLFPLRVMENASAANHGAASAKRRRQRGQGMRTASGPSLMAPQQAPRALGPPPGPPLGMAPVVGSRFMSSTTAEHLTSTRFADLEGISPLTKRALSEVMRYELCTDVQAASLPVCLRGADVCVKAKTGTGKTLAFLIPAFEQLRKDASRRGKIGALIVSPTRELATQIGEEAKTLATFHGFHVQVMFGGTKVERDVERLRKQTPDVLVATPGRLNDHLLNGTLAPCMSELRVLVLDEADRLLDMGFRPALEQLLRALPDKQTRQTVLFSATYPTDIRKLCSFALRPGYEVVDTVGQEDTHAAETVEQMYVVTSLEDQAAALWAAVQAHIKANPGGYKIMAFFVTARLTALYSALFNVMGEPVVEMHSRKSQSARTKAADQFRTGTNCIMFSSDVSARGVDYPDVTLVLQVGLPMEKAQYVHRVGRTARAGKTGQSLILLADYERFFLKQLEDLPLSEVEMVNMAGARAAAAAGLARVEPEVKAQAYRTWLGFYKAYARSCGWDLPQLVEQANHFAYVIGCDGIPPVEPKTAGMMGLKGVPGLNIVRTERSAGGRPVRSLLI